MLHSRRHVMDSAGRRAALLALLLLGAIPAAAQARTFEVDGRVTGPPTARGGTVTVPLQLTKRAGRALKLGTRRVRVRLRRARLPLSGPGTASRLAPRALRAGDRLRGVTSLSKKARLRLRYRYRPTLKLRRSDAVNAQATAAQEGADLASMSAGVDALATEVAGLASGFGALQSSMNRVRPALDGLYADAVALTAMVDALETLGLGGG